MDVERIKVPGDQPPSPQTQRSATDPYGCKDREYSPGYYAPERRYAADGSFTVGVRYLLHKMSKGCMYDKSPEDPRCEGCRHRKEKT